MQRRVQQSICCDTAAKAGLLTPFATGRPTITVRCRMYGGSRFVELLLPLGGTETQCLGVLCNCAFGLVLRAIGERRLDFDADSDFGIGVGGKCRNNFVGNLHEAHLGGSGRYSGGAVE